MSDYYDEMGWTPINREDVEAHQLVLIRQHILMNGGLNTEALAAEILAAELPLSPPASVDVVKALPRVMVEIGDPEKCAVCLKTNDEEELFLIMPCKHRFHETCILAWLEKVIMN